MRKISYHRTEYKAKEKKIENDLLAFIYDIPYIGACGIFPPLQILNRIFLSGGGDGGMGPGAIWEPFEITGQEYEELTMAIASTSPEQLKNRTRYGDIPFEFDSKFDQIKDRLQWIEKVCDKHRGNYHKKIRNQRGKGRSSPGRPVRKTVK
ncbi:MAG: hypothetical protein AB1585_08955 [Thermodesulfobacteriota bacterium]